MRALCRRELARRARRRGARCERPSARKYSPRRRCHALPAPAGNNGFDRPLPLHLGRPRPSRRRQSISSCAERRGAVGPARRRDLSLHQSYRLCPDDLSADLADRLLSDHADIGDSDRNEGCHAGVRSAGGLDDAAIARAAQLAAIAHPALRLASLAVVGVRPQRPRRYRGHRLSAAGLPGRRTALADPCRRRARCRRAGQVHSRRDGSRPL